MRIMVSQSELGTKFCSLNHRVPICFSIWTSFLSPFPPLPHIGCVPKRKNVSQNVPKLLKLSVGFSWTKPGSKVSQKKTLILHYTSIMSHLSCNEVYKTFTKKDTPAEKIFKLWPWIRNFDERNESLCIELGKLQGWFSKRSKVSEFKKRQRRRRWTRCSPGGWSPTPLPCPAQRKKGVS